MSKLERIEQIGSWKRALDAARRTVGKEPSQKSGPSPEWEAKMLLAEHSPIRLVEFDWSWSRIKQWVTAHLVRHHEGCEKFVHSQRSDRNPGVGNRDELPQGTENEMDMTANAQSLINISRKRLCSTSAPETRQAWTQVISGIKQLDPVLASKCVPECIYRGFCPEFQNPCGYSGTLEYRKALVRYRQTKMQAEWKSIGAYEVSDLGDIRYKGFSDNLPTSLDRDGYLVTQDGAYPHVLIWTAWFGGANPGNLGPSDITHLDGNRVNNALQNLIKRV